MPETTKTPVQENISLQWKYVYSLVQKKKRVLTWKTQWFVSKLYAQKKGVVTDTVSVFLIVSGVSIKINEWINIKKLITENMN